MNIRTKRIIGGYPFFADIRHITGRTEIWPQILLFLLTLLFRFYSHKCYYYIQICTMYLYRRGIYLTLEIFAFLLLIHSMYIQPINFSKGVLLVRESQVLAVQALRPAAQTLSPADPQYCQESAKCQVYASFIPIILLTFSQVHPIIHVL